MKRKGYLLLLFVIIIAFWQVFFLQNGMKWDFVDAFLPSRYFFSESILNNQFPLWNPYILYGTPIYADLVSVFNPEFWIIGNMFGYSNITLQFMYLVYIFIAGISFYYFLKQFNTEYKLAVGLSIAYMLSGFSIGNAQHLAFVSGYAILPFTIACYFKFIHQANKLNFFRLSIALFLMIYASYPALTIILGYFLLCVFIYYILINRADKSYIKKLFTYHSILLVTVILFSSVLIVAYIQISPFLSRFGGLPIELAQKHPFSFKSVLSFLLPMATGNDSSYFETDISMSNGYWGVICLILFLFSLTKKTKNTVSYLILFFGVFSLLASFGNQFFLRGFLYKFAPLMNMFQYPAIFRAFTIFSFLAFIGINLNLNNTNKADRNLLIMISGSIIVILLVLIGWGNNHLEEFAFFNANKTFTEELFNSTRFDNIVFQGIIQIGILLVFVFLIWKIRTVKLFSTALLFLFILDGVVATQLNIHYTVISDTNPIHFYKYIKSSPKGFPIPELNSIKENSDKNASNEFIWMNNNIFPKKVTFDGQVAFKSNGYSTLADNYPDLLEVIKKEAVIYLSGDVRENSSIKNFYTNTIFISASDFKKLEGIDLRSDKNDKLKISDFSPTKIEIITNTSYPQLLTYQQNYYAGWKVYIDGVEHDLINSNFAHMSALLPSGKHTVLFKYTNPAIKFAFYTSALIFFVLIAFSIHYFITQHPKSKKRIIIVLASSIFFFILVSFINRYFYQKNKSGLTPVIIEKVGKWKKEYNTDVRILLSTHQNELKKLVPADTICFIDEKTNLSELSCFLINSDSKYFVFARHGGIINDDLLELIYSFYPTIIELEKSNNSGLILVEKSEVKQNYKFIQDFESGGSQEWMQSNMRIKKDSVSGNHSYFFNTNDEWGTTLKIPVGKELKALEKISILADFNIEKKIVETLLVFTTERAGKTQLYQVSKIDKFAKYPDQWSRAVFEVRINSDLLEDDVIKVFFWNKNKARFQIDNLKLKFTYSKSQ